MKQKKLCFWGSDPISIPLLDWMRSREGSGISLVGVITRPDRQSGRGKKPHPTPIKQWALENGIDVLQPEVPGPEEISWMRDNEVELALVMAYGQLLKKLVLNAPRQGMWNLHASVLPELRGASPLETALVEGKTESGVSLMRMVGKMDAGPVADIEKFSIDKTDRAPDLRQKAAAAAVLIMKRNIDALVEGTLETSPQSHDSATYCRRMTKEDGYLDFNLTAEELERRFRACYPWPGTFFNYRGHTLKVGELRMGDLDTAQTEPGVILIFNSTIEITTAAASLKILQLQRPGGRMMDSSSFLRGFPLQSGTKLTFPPSMPWISKKPFHWKPK